MLRRLLGIGLLATFLLSFAACGEGAASNVAPILKDAGFAFIDLVLTSDGDFAAAPDTVLLVKDAFQLLKTIPANQSPPANTSTTTTIVSILYLKHGVYSQDIYRLATGKAKLGILFEGGKTFETISQNSVSIDATQTHQIWIVPLQNASRKVTIKANAGWQNTGIFLVRGKQYKIKYLSGVWTISKGTVGTSDAAGQPAVTPAKLICHCGEPLPGYSTQALIGRIGAGLGNAPLEVGDNFAGVSYDNDFLYMRINLADQLLSFASGTVTMSVETDNLS